MAPGRNEKCRCGSGLKYKHCHHDIDKARGADKYFAAQSVYAQNWRLTSQHHYDDKVYHWLAERLAKSKPKRILDIGCGSGHGLLALREVLGGDVKIVSIDENRACLKATRKTLQDNQKFDAEIITRMSVSENDQYFSHVAGPFEINTDADCLLIESDVCNDPYLGSALQTLAPFDAVTIWLTGVHMLRQRNVNVIKRNIKNDGQHRLYVQNNTYELADALLRGGGVLQVADRGYAPETDALIEDIKKAHGDQASVTSLEVQDVQYRPYSPPNQTRTPMAVTAGTSNKVSANPELAMISIMSSKPVAN